MIVNNTNDGWEIIYQKAHGVLAAAIVQHWKIEERSKKWIETIIAISDHDDNQQYWHGKHHLTKQGTPQDFVFQPPDLKQASRVIESSKFKSGWISLLISEHIHNLYYDFSPGDKNLQKFINDQIKYRKDLSKKLKIDEKELKNSYKLLYWSDRISLILCKNQIPPDEKFLEIAEGPNNIIYSIRQLKNQFLQVTPWPFEVDLFEVSVEVRRLSAVVFEDDYHLHETLENAAIMDRKWVFSKEKE